MNDIQEALLAMADEAYKQFQCGLLPNIFPRNIIGVRTHVLRKFVKSLSDKQVAGFMEHLPHSFHEENNLHAFLIEKIADYDACIAALECFLPYIDNWATCDSLRPKCFAAHKPELLEKIKEWLVSEHTFTVRYAIQMLMVHFLDDEFSEEYPELVALVDSEAYYVRMMVAWYYATALTKQWDSAIVYITEKKLSPWVHNKTIQKAVESYQITPEQKIYLKSLKV